MREKAISVTGGCLCGKVTYSTTIKTGAGVCHCSMCRKWSGGLYMSVHAQSKVEFSGAEYPELRVITVGGAWLLHTVWFQPLLFLKTTTRSARW